jgi:DDE superfamily endonuclease
MTKEAYKRGRIRNAQQDGSREFISLLACVCADGTATPPALIYQGASNDLQTTWLEDLKERDKAYFTASKNGWTNNELGLAWLRRFHEDTQHKSGRSRRRLLILDGHSSHVNMAFISLADSFRILILILPPHSTHRLQPLDVGLFGPLAKAYSKRLDAYTHGGLGWVSMTKRLFWPIFRDAWRDSFTSKNITKAFQATGIWPLQPLLTLAKIQKHPSTYSTPTKLPPLPIATPQTARAVRRLLKSSPTQKKIDLLERAVLRLATRFEIQSFENQGLRVAITQEKKRRQRSKRLNLLGEEDTGVA